MIRRLAICATLAATTLPAAAQDMTSVCYARGSEADGMSGFTHYADGRAVRVDSPSPSDTRSRVVEWQDPTFAQTLFDGLTPGFADIPTDLLAQCDDGWRDTVVITYSDGSTVTREGSCIRNPVAQALDAVFAQSASLVENQTETFTEGAIDGVYAPCAQEW